MAANVLTVYTQASQGARYDGERWYPDARRIMREWSTHYGYSVATCAAVTAAVSPQVEWTRNLIIADDILANRPISIGGARCKRTSRKLSAFVRTISAYTASITYSHMARK